MYLEISFKQKTFIHVEFQILKIHQSFQKNLYNECVLKILDESSEWTFSNILVENHVGLKFDNNFD